jgi:uncharacterized membrane protein
MNWHRRHKEHMRFADRIADRVSAFIGSWLCLWLHTIWFLLWFDLSLDINLLTLIVSLEAIYLCVFLLMSGNRQSERDRHQAEMDYFINTTTKRDLELLQIDIGRIENEKLDTILKLLVGPAMARRKKSTPARRKPKVSRK